MFEFWKYETPEEIHTERLILQWFPESLRLNFILNPWRNIEAGVERQGKRFTINAFYLMHRPKEIRTRIAEMLRSVADQIEKGVSEVGDTGGN